MTTHYKIVKEKPNADHEAAQRRANAQEAKTLRKNLDKMHRDIIGLAARQAKVLVVMRKAVKKTEARFDRELGKAENRLAREEKKIERRLAILEGRS